MERPPDSSATAVLQGSVERITYHDSGTLYTVLRVLPERGYEDPEALPQILPERLTAVGRAPEPGEGLRVRLTGKWGSHPTHGRQFEFEVLETLPPLSEAGLVRYLASKSFEGIGDVLARRIVDVLGSNALAVIRETPEKLDGIQGLRPDVRENLIERVRAELGSQESFAFLLGLGLGPYQAEAVHKRFGLDAEEEVRRDPYVLAHRVNGIGFHTADRVAEKLGVARDAPERRRAALLHVLGAAAGDGHSCLPADELRAGAAELLRDTSEDAFVDPLEDLARAGEVVPDEPDLVYLPHLHTSEAGLASNLRALLGVGELAPLADAEALARAEDEAGIDLHDLQRDAVLGLLRHPVALLTGGPGVGKTTIVRLVVSLAEAAGAKVLLASPTGRAAKRLGEATGRDASTIHRLLGFEPGGGFARGPRAPLEADLVVVDEISMLDVVLAHHLVKAIQPPTRLVLVGDPDQLPSVAAGNVLADLIASGAIPCFRLTQIFRQEESGLIVRNAHRILEGEELDLPARGDTGGDFYFFPVEEPEAAAERLVEVVTRRIPQNFGLNWVEDVQVLSPMYRGPCGVDSLNARLREAHGQEGLEIQWRGRTWRIGDRVIHVRNDYEKEVFNGDMGRIVHVEPDGSGLTVAFPERRVGYAKTEFSDLQPAFAITVHRSQGGEFPAVVLPLVPGHFLMLQRHLLYTAVTRARRLVVLVGSQRALRMALDNVDQRLRRSGLGARLRGD